MRSSHWLQSKWSIGCDYRSTVQRRSHRSWWAGEKMDGQICNLNSRFFLFSMLLSTTNTRRKKDFSFFFGLNFSKTSTNFNNQSLIILMAPPRNGERGSEVIWSEDSTVIMSSVEMKGGWEPCFHHLDIWKKMNQKRRRGKKKHQDCWSLFFECWVAVSLIKKRYKK